MFGKNKMSSEMKAMIKGTDDYVEYPDIPYGVNYEDVAETSRVDFELFKTMDLSAKSKINNRIYYRTCLPKEESILRVEYDTLDSFDKRYWDGCQEKYPDYPWILD